MCTGRLAHHEQTVRGRVVMHGSRMRRVCAVTLVHYEQIVRERVVMLPRRMRRVCTDTPVHYEQTVRQGAAGRVTIYVPIWVVDMGWCIHTLIYHIDIVILDINMGYGLMIWEMTVSIWEMTMSIWDILSLWWQALRRGDILRQILRALYPKLINPVLVSEARPHYLLIVYRCTCTYSPRFPPWPDSVA